MARQLLKIFNGRIITPDRIIEDGVIVVNENTIAQISEDDIELENVIEINAHGNYISPGFIDIHVHGGGGYDFMDGTETAFLKIANTHARFGTTSMVPTTLTSDKENLLHVLKIYEEANKNNTAGAQFLGMHLEGPYFSLSQIGAHDTRYIRNPDPSEYIEILSKSNAIVRWSAAPELEGAIDFGRYLRSKGVIAAVAHTDAIYEDIVEAFANGYSLITHLYSAMSGVTRRSAFRYAGVIESAYVIDDLDVEIIADGIHLPAPLLKLVYKIKGANRIALITDAMRAAGMPPGESVLGNLQTGIKVVVEDGVAKLPDRTSFAGSVATADRLVRSMINMADVSLMDAIKMMTSTPARIMGISERKGSLVEGKDADIIIFDDNIDIKMTIINGTLVYEKTNDTNSD